MPSPLTIPISLLALALPAPQAPEVLRSWSVPATRLELLTDLDGDGQPEVLAANRLHSPPALGSAGIVRVLSSSGSVLFENPGTTAGQQMGFSMAALGDVNGDGHADYMGSGSTGRARIFSGLDGGLLFQPLQVGRDAAALGDVDDDGFDDFLLGTGTRAVFYLGGSFQVRQVILPPPDAVDFGTKTVALGDLDGDAFVDFAISAPGEFLKILPPGEVFVYSGSTGTLLYALEGDFQADRFGETLEAPGDFDADGIRDLVVGASSSTAIGRIYFHDGETGARLGVLVAPPGSDLADQLDAGGDVNGNGIADVLVSLNGFPGRKVQAVDGGTRAVFLQHELGSQDVFAGGGHDWNRDGFPDFLVGRPDRVEVLSGAPPRTGVGPRGCGSVLGFVPRIGASGAPALGSDYAVHVSNLPAGAPVVLRLGGVSLRSLPTSGRGGCLVLAPPLSEYPATTQKIGPGLGAATIELSIPPDAGLLGREFEVQWIVPGSAGQVRAVTRILRPTIG